MKTSDLAGALLDCWVAKAERRIVEICEDDGVCRLTATMARYEPHRDWAIGGPIIERERGGIWPEMVLTGEPALYGARMGEGTSRYQAFGPTHLVAAMRAFVGSRFGAEVTDEESCPAT